MNLKRTCHHTRSMKMKRLCGAAVFVVAGPGADEFSLSEPPWNCGSPSAHSSKVLPSSYHRSPLMSAINAQVMYAPAIKICAKRPHDWPNSRLHYMAHPVVAHCRCHAAARLRRIECRATRVQLTKGRYARGRCETLISGTKRWTTLV